jgi:DNA helicase-2/ATP-dependent DNA helicase PcrA
VVAKMGILKYIMQQPDKGAHMQMLTSFFDFLKDESRKNPEIKLADLIATIDLMKKNNIRMELNKVIFSDNGINFLDRTWLQRVGVRARVLHRLR